MTLPPTGFRATLAVLAPPVLAQEATIAFGALEQDTTLPVNGVAADQLSVNNADGTATLSGNVVVTQGKITLSAATMLITYGKPTGKSIDQLTATGGVKVTNLGDAAQGNEAVYFVSTGMIELSGRCALDARQLVHVPQKLTINLKDGPHHVRPCHHNLHLPAEPDGEWFPP